MNIRNLLAAGALAVGLSMAGGQALALDNGSFETLDFSGWTTNGFLSVVGSAGSSQGANYTATDGDVFARLDAGVGEGVFTTLSQTFTLLTAGTLSGDAAFLAFDYMPYDDDSYVRIFDINTSQTVFSASVGSVGDYGATGWTRFSANLGPGQYTLEAGVRNNTDNSMSSALLVDNVALQTGAVPEPGTWALMILGFGSVGAMVRRRRMILA